MRLGLALDHAGPDARFSFPEGPGQPVPLPTAVQGGARYRRALGGRLDLGAGLEARCARGRPPVSMIGAEVTHPTGAALRLGARVNDDAVGVSVGAGYALPALRLDYAFVPYRLDLGETHRVSFTARF